MDKDAWVARFKAALQLLEKNEAKLAGMDQLRGLLAATIESKRQSVGDWHETQVLSLLAFYAEDQGDASEARKHHTALRSLLDERFVYYGGALFSAIVAQAEFEASVGQLAEADGLLAEAIGKHGTNWSLSKTLIGVMKRVLASKQTHCRRGGITE